MGTGNDLSRVLGWGEGQQGDIDAHFILDELENAQPVRLDRWKVDIYPSQKLFRKQNRVMNNYISVGVDAQVTALSDYEINCFVAIFLLFFII